MSNCVNDVFKKVEIRSFNECWPWFGKWKASNGYGRLDIQNTKGVYAHRAAYLSAHPGEIELRTTPDRSLKQYVLHSCDNPACCNPAHLYLGTHDDNMKDKVKRDRCSHLFGERGPNAKLTNEQAEEIRWIFSKGIARKEIASLYGLSKSCVDFVLTHRTFKHTGEHRA